MAVNVADRGHELTEIKPATDDHHEEDTDKVDPAERQYQLKSDHDQTSWGKTFWQFRKAVLICSMVCVVGACDGYQINLNGSIIANAGFTRKIGFPRPDGTYALNAQYTALWGGLQSLGQGLSFLSVTTLVGKVAFHCACPDTNSCIHPITDRLGRKYTLYLMWLILATAVAIESAVQNWQQWAGAKLLAGLGIGCLQMTLPVYIAEWSPVNIRGSMVLAYGIWNNIGNFLAPVVLLIAEAKDPMDYRTPIWTQWAFVGFSLPLLIYLPETASYYAVKGQHEQGLKTLARVYGGVPGYNLETEYSIILHTIEEENKVKALEVQAHSLRQVLRSYVACFRGSNLRRTFGASMSFILQSCTGLSFLNIYAALFFRQAGFANPFDITAILTAIKICGILLCVFLADNIGRRRIVLFAGTWCTLMLVIVGAAGQRATTTPMKNLVIAAACFWSIGNSPLGSMGFTLVGEIPSQKLRARTAGVSQVISVIFGLIFNTAMPIMLDVNGANLGYNTAWIFVGLGAIACGCAFVLVPETARRGGAEIDEMYEKRISCWRMRNFVTDAQTEQRSRLARSNEITETATA